MSADYVRQIRCMFYLKNAPHDQKLARLLDTASKFALFFGVRFERRKVDKKQTYTKTEICKPYSRVFWMFLPNVVKIDPYNFEVYRFKVCAFFSETQCRSDLRKKFTDGQTDGRTDAARWLELLDQRDVCAGLAWRMDDCVLYLQRLLCV